MSDSFRLPSFSNPLCRSSLSPPSISLSLLPQSSSASSLYPPFHHAHTRILSEVHGRAFTDLIGGGASLDPDSSSSPLFVQLFPICDEPQFDQVVSEKPAVILWMASWCRKCIYLKPKLEKLAAEFIPRMQFYCVDVNKVPHKLVARAGVTKMPTVQVWRDGRKEGEVVGGHKAHWVINEVRQMIDNESEV